MNDILRNRAAMSDRLEKTEQNLAADAALSILVRPGELYANTTDDHWRILSQAVFSRIFVHADEVTEVEFNEPFDMLMAAEELYENRTKTAPEDRGGDMSEEAASLVTIALSDTSSNADVVGLVEAYSNKSGEAGHLRKLACSTASRAVEEQPPIAPRKARRLTDAEKSRFVDRYMEGALIADVAAELGVHRTTLNNLVIRLQLRRADPRAVPAGIVATAVHSYGAGKTLAELGIELGFSPNKVQRMPEAAGESIRPRGPKSERLTREQSDEIVTLYVSGRSIAAIASQLSVSYASVRKHLIRAEVERRPRGGAHA